MKCKLDTLGIGVLLLVGACSSVPRGAPAPVEAASSAPAEGLGHSREGLRSPYGWGYRVGMGYAYRHWTW